MDPIVETKNLRVEFRAQNSGQAKKVAVKDLNLSVRAGEVFGFLGPNGAGKTTTMNVLRGFVNATSGAGVLVGYAAQAPDTVKGLVQANGRLAVIAAKAGDPVVILSQSTRTTGSAGVSAAPACPGLARTGTRNGRGWRLHRARSKRRKGSDGAGYV
jgi:energy-coupling factor transporter ATP-binding protein EcfA2